MVPIIGIVGPEKKSIRLANAINVAFFLLTRESTIDKPKYDIRYIKEGKSKVLEVCTGETLIGKNMIMNRRFDKSLEAVTEMLESHFGSACFIDSLLDGFNSSCMWVIPDVTREEEIIKIRKRNGVVISIDKTNSLTPCVETLISNIDFTSNTTIVDCLMKNTKFWKTIDANYLL